MKEECKGERSRGELSVYLALMLAVMIPLIVTMMNAARISAMKLQVECALDMGMDSMMAEYHRELLEQYDLLMIDTAYEQEFGSLDHTLEHLEGYLSYNLNPDKDVLVWGARDLYGLSIDSLELVRVSRATDDNGKVFRNMVMAYMLERYGLAYISDAKDLVTTSESANIYNSDIVADNYASQAQIDGIRVEETQIRTVERTVQTVSGDEIITQVVEEEIEETVLVKPQMDDPTTTVAAATHSGILSMVCKGGISARTITPSNYVSGRTLIRGNGVSEEWKEYNNLEEQLLFNEYILEKCGNYIEPKDNSLLCYEVEYILFGTASDADNLEKVATRLLLLRGGANTAYFFTDSELVQEARTLAEGLSVITTLPELEPVFEAAIISAWIFAESVVDVRDLFDGKRVPLIKTKGEWRLSLENALSFALDSASDAVSEHSSGDGNAQGTAPDGAAPEGAAPGSEVPSGTASSGTGEEERTPGLNYKDYLRLMLYTVSLDERTMRCMDVVEMDIRKAEGNASFCLDNCIAAATVQGVFQSRYGYEFLVERNFCYY